VVLAADWRMAETRREFVSKHTTSPRRLDDSFVYEQVRFSVERRVRALGATAGAVDFYYMVPPGWPYAGRKLRSRVAVRRLVDTALRQQLDAAGVRFHDWLRWKLAACGATTSKTVRFLVVVAGAELVVDGGGVVTAEASMTPPRLRRACVALAPAAVHCTLIALGANMFRIIKDTPANVFRTPSWPSAVYGGRCVSVRGVCVTCVRCVCVPPTPCPCVPCLQTSKAMRWRRRG